MGHKVEQSLINSRIDFFCYAFRNVLLISIPLLVVSALILGFSIPHSSATVGGASADSLTLSLPTSCTLSSVVNSAHNATLISGTYTPDIGKTTITTLCNDGNGYAIYANGLSNGTVGNNALISSVSSNHNIATGIYKQGDTTSSWAMKLGNVSGDTSPTPPVIEQGYNNTYGIVPSTWTKVAGRQSGTTDMITGSSFTTTYAVYTTPTQHAGTYTGQIGYLLVHSYNDNLLPNEPYFMQDVTNWKDDLVEDVAVQAIDKRDFKSYSVTKLKDGHIWMTQNLNFDITGTTLNSNTTDLNTIYNPSNGDYAEYENGYSSENGIIYWTPASSATPISFEGNTANNWLESTTIPYSAKKTDDLGTGHSSAGIYYNWTAAIASNDSSTLTSDTLDDTNNNPQNSICPKGWRLPTISSESETIIGSTNEFARLNYLYNNGSTTNGTKLFIAPLWFATNGSLYWKKLESFSITSTLWSSTVANNGPKSSYYASFRANSVNMGLATSEYVGRAFGFGIRCIAR